MQLNDRRVLRDNQPRSQPVLRSEHATGVILCALVPLYQPVDFSVCKLHPGQ